jgi:hypothetical protein
MASISLSRKQKPVASAAGIVPLTSLELLY